jgi:hypothetical protein
LEAAVSKLPERIWAYRYNDDDRSWASRMPEALNGYAPYDNSEYIRADLFAGYSQEQMRDAFEAGFYNQGEDHNAILPGIWTGFIKDVIPASLQYSRDELLQLLEAFEMGMLTPEQLADRILLPQSNQGRDQNE